MTEEHIGKHVHLLGPQDTYMYILTKQLKNLELLILRIFTIYLVSEDLNINDIVESNLVDVVISSGALRKLLDFTQVNASWFLPIVVKSVIVKRGKF